MYQVTLCMEYCLASMGGLRGEPLRALLVLVLLAVAVRAARGPAGAGAGRLVRHHVLIRKLPAVEVPNQRRVPGAS